MARYSSTSPCSHFMHLEWDEMNYQRTIKYYIKSQDITTEKAIPFQKHTHLAVP